MPKPYSSEQLSQLTAYRFDERLAVFGSLRPGACNFHLLKPLGGIWFTGWVSGILEQRGWAAAQGYPGIRLMSGQKVNVDLLCSHSLPKFWPKLDEFEGSDYRRVTTIVRIAETAACGQIYELRPEIDSSNRVARPFVDV
ncbi:MAG: gamma-glutamylcyclotransferase [Sphingomonas sp.]|uniref:gamma-glutamylcyclotransferase family protein n=1 Tax=Sphingomonas sp. TaxID=28214 RepID=UPI0018038401|nr:gamma-glutamylcyclotransferase [Sphingomonas sp.]